MEGGGRTWVYNEARAEDRREGAKHGCVSSDGVELKHGGQSGYGSALMKRWSRTGQLLTHGSCDECHVMSPLVTSCDEFPHHLMCRCSCDDIIPDHSRRQTGKVIERH